MKTATLQIQVNSYGFNTLDITVNLNNTNSESINKILAFSLSESLNENITIEDVQQYIDSMFETKEKYLSVYIDEKIVTINHEIS